MPRQSANDLRYSPLQPFRLDQTATRTPLTRMPRKVG
jgi:hypothetical protein